MNIKVNRLPDTQAVFENYNIEINGKKYIMRNTYIDNKIVNTEYFDSGMNMLDMEDSIKIEEAFQNWLENE